jgi:histidine triad (HIT) family protein
MHSTSCIFCKIAAGEIPSEKIFENADLLAFLDIRPVTKGHALVVPKKHVANFVESDDETLTKSVVQVRKIADAILRATGAKGFNLHVNNGEVAGQIVPHLHFHIIPRYADDGLKHWPGRDIEPKTRKEIAEEIKKYLT